ncbi:hypothetical protein VTN96DRAFT_1624 [Rasamsonia emersonii]
MPRVQILLTPRCCCSTFVGEHRKGKGLSEMARFVLSPLIEIRYGADAPLRGISANLAKDWEALDISAWRSRREKASLAFGLESQASG